MMLNEFGAQTRAVEMDIDFGGGDGFVAEHFLNCAKIGTPFEKVGGERMTQSVR